MGVDVGRLKPGSCCEMGMYTCQVPMPIRGRVQGIDLCICDIVAALNAANIVTVASCCGHGKMPGNVMLEDGRVLSVRPAKEEPSDAELLRKAYQRGLEEEPDHKEADGG